MAKQDRVRNLHHCGFKVQREQGAVRFCFFDLLCQKALERCCTHECCVYNGASRVGQIVFQNGFAARRFQNDFRCAVGAKRGGGFIREKVIA